MGNDDRLRLDTSAARRHLADCTPAQIETFRQGANDACIDCGDVPEAGGARCLPCFVNVARPLKRQRLGGSPEPAVPYVDFRGAA